MRKRKVILLYGLLVLLSISKAGAQSVWSSPDTYSHTIEIYYKDDGASSALRVSDNRIQLDFLSSLIKQNRDKIQSKEFSIWVESYVENDSLQPEECRRRARMLSNTLKSHLISNYGVKESDFMTRNNCGTYDGKQCVTIVALGLRYPWERILPLQLLDLTGVSEPAGGQPPLISTPSQMSPLEHRSSNIPNIDTAKILTPRFKVQTWTVTPPTIDNSKPASTNSSYRLPTSGGSNMDSVIVDYRSVRGIASFGNTKSTTQTLAAKQQVLGYSSSNFDMIMAAPKSITPPSTAVATDPIEETKRPRKDSQDSINTVVAGAVNTAPSIMGSDVVASTKTSPAKKTPTTPGSSFVGLVPPLMIPISSGVASSQSGAPSQSKGGSYGNALQTGIAPPLAIANSGGMQGRESLKIDTKQLESTFNTHIMSYDDVAQDVKPKKIKEAKLPALRKSKYKGIPTVEIGPDGSMKINASALQESLNQEFYLKQEIEHKEKLTAQQKVTKSIALHATLERQRAMRDAKGRFAMVGLGINALPALAAMPAMQLDFYIHNRFSLSVEGAYSSWNLLGNMYRTNVWTVSPEFRVWTCRAKKFTGVYVGLYGMMGEYNFRWNSRRGEQGNLWSAGLSVGYVLQFGRSNFFMDAGVSGGYLVRDIDHYIYHQNDNYFQGTSKQYNFAPTKAKVTFIYRFFNKRKSE